MAYAAGSHPHIRSNDSLAGRYWTAVVFLIPSAFIKIAGSWPKIFLLAALFLVTAAAHFILDAVNLSRAQNSGWRQGFLAVYILLWFLILPEKTNFGPAILSFLFSFVFIYEFFGGLGAYPIHPVLGGVLILRLFLYRESVNTILEPSSYFIWGCASLLPLAFGGIYLGIQKKIRLIPAISFIGTVIFLSWVSGRVMDIELFYALFIFGFYILTDTAVSPLKAGPHLFTALGSAFCMSLLMLLGGGIIGSGAVALAVWNLISQVLDSLSISGLKSGRILHG